MAEHTIGNDHILSTKFLIKAIKEGQENGERFCFILGAGASVSSGIPTGAELEYKWMEDMNQYPGIKEVRLAAEALKEHLDHNFEEIEKVWKDAKEQKRKSLPSEYYFDIYTLRFHPNHRNGYHYLENLMECTKPSFGYHPLSLLLTDGGGSNLVITTNFDSLVEDSLFLYTDKKPLVINHELLAEFAGDLNIKRPIVAKIHRGLFFNPLNRTEETNKLHGRWKEVLEKVFQNYTPIVIGYGGGDGSLMGVLKEESVEMKNGIYWCYVEKYGLPNSDIQTIIENKKGYLVRTAGFDAVMLAIGNAFFPNKIDPAETEKYLGNKIDLQIENYREEYERLIVEEKDGTKEQTTESEKEFEKDKEKFITRVNQSEDKREKQKQMTVWDYIQQGDRYYNAGKYKKSIEFYSKAIELRPIAIAYSNRGCAYNALGEREKAIQDYTKAIELNPNYMNAYYNRGCAYSALGEREKAIQDYTKAIELNPNYMNAYYNRGNAYDALEESEKAIEDYTKAIELDANDAAAYYNRGNAYSGLGEREKAIEDYTKVIELEPKNKQVYMKRAKIYRVLGKEEKAITDEEMVLKL